MPGPRKKASGAAIDPAKQSQAGPIPAEIVKDRRDTAPRRLTKLALAVAIIILLGWIINGQIDTHRQLHQAERDRSALIDDVTHLARIMGKQGFDLRALRQAIIEQNKILRANGLETIPVPPITSEQGRGGNHPQSHGDGSNSSQPPSSPPSSKPPSQSPSPTSSPPVIICLPVVHCVTPGLLEGMTVLDWERVLAQAIVENDLGYAYAVSAPTRERRLT